MTINCDVVFKYHWSVIQNWGLWWNKMCATRNIGPILKGTYKTIGNKCQFLKLSKWLCFKNWYIKLNLARFQIYFKFFFSSFLTTLWKSQSFNYYDSNNIQYANIITVSIELWSHFMIMIICIIHITAFFCPSDSLWN